MTRGMHSTTFKPQVMNADCKMSLVYALYNRNLKLTAVLALLFCGEVAYLSYVLSVVAPRLTFNADCFVTSSPKIFVSYWYASPNNFSPGSLTDLSILYRIVSLIFETILFLLTLYKFFEAVWSGWGKRPVMKQFIGDGTWAYTLIFGMSPMVSRISAPANVLSPVAMLINSLLYKLVHTPLAGICFTCVHPHSTLYLQQD